MYVISYLLRFSHSHEAKGRLLLLLVVVLVLTGFCSGGLFGFLVGSALGMLADLLLFFVADDRVGSVALDSLLLRLLLLFVAVVVIGLLGPSSLIVSSFVAWSTSGVARAVSSGRVLPSVVAALAALVVHGEVVDSLLDLSAYNLGLLALSSTEVARAPVGEARVVLCRLALLLRVLILVLGLLVDCLDLVLGCGCLRTTHLLVILLIN